MRGPQASDGAARGDAAFMGDLELLGPKRCGVLGYD